MLKAVAFDLWETLITDTPEISRRQEELRLRKLEGVLAARGYGSTAEEIEAAHRGQWRRCFDLYWSVDRDVPARTQIIHFLEELRMNPASFSEEVLAEIERAYVLAALEIPPVMVPSAVDVIRVLRARGFLIGLISNTGRTPGSVLRDVLESMGLARSIDVMVFSNEHGECKPRPSIFAKLHSLLGLEPSEIAFVGDNLYVDVFGAQQSGMKGIHFRPEQRGMAVAPLVDHGFEIVPDATIARLDQLPAVVEEWRS